MNKYVIMITSFFTFCNINPSSPATPIPALPADITTSAIPAGDATRIIMGYILKVQKLIPKMEETITLFKKQSDCFNNQSASCPTVCKDKKECAAMILNTATGIIAPFIELLFAKVDRVNPKAVEPGIIPVLLNAGGFRGGIKKMQELIPKALKVGQTLDLGMVYIDNLSLLLAPGKVAASMPEIKADSVELD
jgi:hypothetical protein